jgi:hypothetical protein
MAVLIRPNPVYEFVCEKLSKICQNVDRRRKSDKAGSNDLNKLS